MSFSLKFFIPVVMILLVLSDPLGARAHEGHDHGEPETVEAVTGTVTLSDAAISNIGVQTVPATRDALEIVSTLYGVVIPDPAKHFRLNARFSGQITSVQVGVGSRVKEGDILLVAEPQQVGGGLVTFKAPFSGVVTAQQMTALGESFTPDQTLIEIVDTAEVIVKGQSFDAAEVASFQKGQRVTVKSPLDEYHTLTGVVERVSQAVNPETLSFEVFVRVGNPDRLPLINSRVTVGIVTSSLSNRLVIPAGAILGEGGNYFVFTRKENAFSRRPVRIGKRTNSVVEVLKGLSENDLVVVQGHHQLQFTKPSEAPHG